MRFQKVLMVSQVRFKTWDDCAIISVAVSGLETGAISQFICGACPVTSSQRSSKCPPIAIFAWYAGKANRAACSEKLLEYLPSRP